MPTGAPPLAPTRASRQPPGGNNNNNNAAASPRQPIPAEKAEGDWQTIDWVHSQGEAVDREARKRASASKGFTRDQISQNESFLAALVAGVILGILGVFSDACSHFVSVFRSGICVNYFWLGRSLCCIDEEDCPEYYTWGEFFAGRGNRVVGFTNFVFYVFLSVVFGSMASFFCKYYASYASGGGINEVKTIVSGHNVKRYLGVFTMVTKTIGMCLSTGCGLVVGKEGPFVHIGACVGDLTSRLFAGYRIDSKKRELITAGAAGGLAVAFGAPVGGVIFALEEVSSFYNFKALMSALICGVTAVLVQSRVDLWHTGRIVQFSVNYQHDWHFIEIPAFAALGAFCGLGGSLFNEVNIKIIRWRKRTIKNWRVTEVAVFAGVCAVLNFFTPYAKGGLLELLGDLFQDCTPGSKLEICKESDLVTMVQLIICGCVKLALFIYGVGTYVPSGVLVPSLAIGALFGRAFGLFVHALQQNYGTLFLFNECSDQQSCIIPGAYAIVGAAAFLTGITRMTICLAVIMFELTGSVNYLVPVIIGILAAKAAGEGIGVEGVYEIGIEENQLPFLDPKKEFTHSSNAGDIVRVSMERQKRSKYLLLTGKGVTVEKLNSMLEVDVTGFPVILNEESQTLLGYATTKTVIKTLHDSMTRGTPVHHDSLLRFFPAPTEADPLLENEIDLSMTVQSSMIQVEPNCPVSRILYLFKSVGSRHIMVSRLSSFAGLISKKDLIHFMRVIEKAEHDEEKSVLKSHKQGH